MEFGCSLASRVSAGGRGRTAESFPARGAAVAGRGREGMACELLGGGAGRPPAFAPELPSQGWAAITREGRELLGDGGVKYG